jgi:predicted component of type VI protein secretion system
MLAYAVLACVVLAFTGCGQQEARARIPVSIQAADLPGEPWQRDKLDPIAADAFPQTLRKLGATTAQSAVFRQADRSVSVRVFQLANGTVAFEASQTYPRSANEYYFQMGASFVVVEAETLRPEERRPFLVAFQAAAMPQAQQAQGQ